MLRISLDDINKSIKFSAFIAFGILFLISIYQIIVDNTLFWELIAFFSGIGFILLLASVLFRVLKPSFTSWKKKKTKTRRRKGKTFFEAIASLFRQNTYFKIMAIVWFIVILVGLELAIRFIGLVESEQGRFRVLANFGFMIITISTALFVFNLSRIFKKKKRR